jgi:hypothetical protein
MRNVMSWIKTFSIQVSGVVILFFSSDFIYTNSFTTPTNQELIDRNQERRYRIENDIFHHSLLPSYDGMGVWGGEPYRVCTDVNGFKSDCGNIFTSRTNFDIAFIGDSFTEAIGVPYEDSFVGLFANANPDLNVANLGVVSYAPTVYRAKIEDFIRRGYEFNHVIVFVDISDIQDESQYFRDSRGNVLQSSNGAINQSALLSEVKIHVKNNFSLFAYAYRSVKQILIGDEGTSTVFSLERSEWTYDASSNAYGELGVNGSLEKAVREMTMLHELLEGEGVKLSVGVYPWPAQIREMMLNDSDSNMQAEIWRDFCINRCVHFINMFPRYFDLVKNSSVDDVYNRYFIQGDVHYNREGNQLIHEALLELNLVD